MENSFDCLIIGAGYAGAVAARELAERGGRRVLVLERRDHIGGNAYDCPDAHGVLIHQYGPHIFHTSNKRVFDWLSRFTDVYKRQALKCQFEVSYSFFMRLQDVCHPCICFKFHLFSPLSARGRIGLVVSRPRPVVRCGRRKEVVS